MITQEALQEAIAECEGNRNPNRDTCMMLAAFYTIQDHLFDRKESYSYAPPPTVEKVGDSEFLRAVAWKSVDDVLSVLDEAMRTLQVMTPRLYKGILRELSELKTGR